MTKLGEPNPKGHLQKERCCKGCELYLICQYDSKVRQGCVAREMRGDLVDVDERKQRVKRRVFINKKEVK